MYALLHLPTSEYVIIKPNYDHNKELFNTYQEALDYSLSVVIRTNHDKTRVYNAERWDGNGLQTDELIALFKKHNVYVYPHELEVVEV